MKDLEAKEVELKKQLEYYRSDEYVEKMAREKLLLQKEGETVILLPEQQSEGQSEEENKQTELSIWQKWVRLIRFRF